jgi:hypothetical protein
LTNPSRKYLFKSTSSWILINSRTFLFNSNKLYSLKIFKTNSKQSIKIYNNITICKNKITVLRLDTKKSNYSINKKHSTCEISFLYLVKNYVSKWKPIIKMQKQRKNWFNTNNLAKAKSTLIIYKNQSIQSKHHSHNIISKNKLKE